ncbi:DUF2746 domain-containing protein [Actinomyces bowdenii]|uniref:DUF2746 domain-containing protein n=1 Tax=Actinomyces bowdenii TaxID=131109 RepID=UPI00214B1B9D|nr:DUF2746 domain-containing protein [Actinomyces bowdenii]MCR2051967.1 DUF2746 domain-containing protein [Actinomyces bowdenii]
MSGVLSAVADPAWRDPAWLTAVTGLLSALIGGLAAALTGRRRQGHTLDALKAIKRSADAANEGVNNSHSTNLRDDLDKVQATVTRLETGLGKLDSKVDVLADLIVDFERCSRQRDEATQASADTSHAAMHRRLDALEAAQVPSPQQEES